MEVGVWDTDGAEAEASVDLAKKFLNRLIKKGDPTSGLLFYFCLSMV